MSIICGYVLSVYFNEPSQLEKQMMKDEDKVEHSPWWQNEADRRLVLSCAAEFQGLPKESKLWERGLKANHDEWLSRLHSISEWKLDQESTIDRQW
jgi:hypothetical protein